MKKYSFIFYFIFFAFSLGYAQQFEFEKTYKGMDGFSFRFNDRYTVKPAMTALIRNGSFYRSKKVKKILVYSNNNKLAYLFELDTAGSVITSGFETSFYFTTTSTKGANPYTYVQSYYKDSVLMMTDSIFQKKLFTGITIPLCALRIQNRAYIKQEAC